MERPELARPATGWPRVPVMPCRCLLRTPTVLRQARPQQRGPWHGQNGVYSVIQRGSPTYLSSSTVHEPNRALGVDVGGRKILAVADTGEHLGLLGSRHRDDGQFGAVDGFERERQAPVRVEIV